MTDKKISALTDLGGAPASTDVLPIVDSSANQTKKVSVEDLFTNPDVTGTLTAASVNTGAGVAGRNAFSSGDIRIAAPNDANISLMTISDTLATIKTDYYGGGSLVPLVIQTGTNANQLYLSTSGNVGIGTSSPSAKLQLNEAAATDVTFTQSNTVASTSLTQSANGSYYLYNYGAYNLIFGTSATERMRIDSSGNVLVGTTDTSPATNNIEGICLRNEGHVNISRASGVVGYFNRKTDDGDIIRLLKDGTTVGSIGTYSGGIDLAGSSRGIRLTASSFFPVTNAGSVSDNTTNLGYSGGRFKDLYLSGGVYLGGITSANLLDDYEEGTWTPTIVGSVSNPTVTYTENSGTYTKVGNLVTVACYVDIATYSGGSGSVVLSGLPFVSNATSAYRAGGVVTFANGWTTAPIALLTIAGQITAVFRDGNQSPIDVGDVGAGDEVRVVLSYFV